VKEPEVWAENQKIQTTTKQEVKLPLFAIFKRQYLWNTLTGCLWMAANFCVYYSIWALVSTYLQKELAWTPAMVAALGAHDPVHHRYFHHSDLPDDERTALVHGRLSAAGFGRRR
jgi:hypothetical protein